MKEMKSEATGEGLVADGKVYYFRVAAPSYPVTVQFDYEIKFKGTLNYPDYRIEYPDQSVEYSSYTASIPGDLDLNLRQKIFPWILPWIILAKKKCIHGKLKIFPLLNTNLVPLAVKAVILKY